MLSSTFLFSFPSTYFCPITTGFAACFLPKCSGVKSAEGSAFALKVMVITELHDQREGRRVRDGGEERVWRKNTA